MKKWFILGFASMLCANVAAWGAPAMKDETDLKTFRQEREESLKKNWLVVVGLAWLREGENSIGSHSEAKVILPKGAPAHLGKISLQNGRAEIKFEETVGVALDGRAVSVDQSYPLLSDRDGKAPTMISVGTVKLYLIDRASGLGLRIKDTESETLKKFTGLNWWEPKAEFRIVGKWKKLDPPRTLRVPDVLGNTSEEKIQGSVVFSFQGKSYELFPTRTGDDLFFVFKDLTTAKSSYGTGRFLDAKITADGQVVLDFNRAYNPPCAQIAYATCPIAPAENKLDVAIEAGEKKPTTHP